MLILMIKTIINEVIIIAKQLDIFELLTDKVNNISNICPLISFLKYGDLEERKADTVYIDHSGRSSSSSNVSPNTYTIVSCLTEKLNKINLEKSKLRALV